MPLPSARNDLKFLSHPYHENHWCLQVRRKGNLSERRPRVVGMLRIR
jgi:hypothetical protein